MSIFDSNEISILDGKGKYVDGQNRTQGVGILLEMSSSLKRRIVLLAIAPLSGAAGYLYLGGLGDSLPDEMGDDLAGTATWLAICSALFVINYVVAWHHRSSWPMTMARLLIWGLGGYLCISNLVDLIGENKEAAWQILGLEGPAGSELVIFLRGSVLGWGLCLAMSIVAIAAGFEKEQSEEDQGEESDS